MIIYSNCFNVLGMGSLANISMVAKKKKKNTGLKTNKWSKQTTLQRRSTTLNLLNLYFRQNHRLESQLWHVTFLWCGHNMRVSLLIGNGTLVRILLAPAVNQFECESGERTAAEWRGGRRRACLCGCDADKTAGSISNCVKRLRAQCVWKVNTAHPLWQSELPPPHVSSGYVRCGALLARGPVAQRSHVHSSGHVMEL